MASMAAMLAGVLYAMLSGADAAPADVRDGDTVARDAFQELDESSAQCRFVHEQGPWSDEWDAARHDPANDPPGECYEIEFSYPASICSEQDGMGCTYAGGDAARSDPCYGLGAFGLCGDWAVPLDPDDPCRGLTGESLEKCRKGA